MKKFTPWSIKEVQLLHQSIIDYKQLQPKSAKINWAWISNQLQSYKNTSTDDEKIKEKMRTRKDCLRKFLYGNYFKPLHGYLNNSLFTQYTQPTKNQNKSELSDMKGIGKWKSEETQCLKLLVQIHLQSQPESSKIPWQKIATLLNINRSPLQCRNHYFNYCLKEEFYESGRWTLNEDLLLLKGHELYQNQWLKISKEVVKTRTGHQCHERFKKLSKRTVAKS